MWENKASGTECPRIYSASAYIVLLHFSLTCIFIIISTMESQSIKQIMTIIFPQVMSTRNRERVARGGLETVVKMTRDFAGDLEMAKASTGT